MSAHQDPKPHSSRLGTIYKTPLDVFNYDEIPPGYYFKAMLEGKATQRFWHLEKFAAVIDAIQDGQNVLDLGCGPGSLLYNLASRYPKCTGVGVDIASKQIEFAREHVALQFNGRIEFKTLDANRIQLPYPDSTFDAITCVEVIEHLHPYIAHRMIEDAKRVLKPGGKIIVTTPNYRSFWPFIELGLEFLSPVKYHHQHINKFTPNSFVKFLESAGLAVTQFRSVFILSPFLAGLSWRLAKGAFRLENRAHFFLGSLLVAECQVVDFK